MMIVASDFVDKNGTLNNNSFTGAFTSADVNPQNKLSVDAADTYSLVADKTYPAKAVWLIQNPNKGKYIEGFTFLRFTIRFIQSSDKG